MNMGKGKLKGKCPDCGSLIYVTWGKKGKPEFRKVKA